MEEWKDITGFYGYQVSNLCRVKSLNYYRKGFEKIMKLQVHPKGYSMVDLQKNGSKVNRRVHRLVALEFIPNPNNFPLVCHKMEDLFGSIRTNKIIYEMQ